MITSDQVFFFLPLFPPLDKVMKTLLHETSEALYNDIWVMDWAAAPGQEIGVKL